MATEVQIPNPTGTIQRPLRGSRISTFYPVKSLPALSSLDSAFQLQEYISLLIRLDVHDVEAITTLPGKSKDAKEKEAVSGEKETKTEEEGKDGAGGEEKDVTVDEACWIYEQLRRLAQDLTHPLITTLQQECSRATCPEMKAGEWLYLCVAHGTEGAMEQCCAIDYILHTLDSATALLNSPRAFPSRLQIPTSSHRHFPSLARRLGRIFAHAYFHHREAFEQAEAESSLYARFLTLTSKFDLVPTEAEAIAKQDSVDSQSHAEGGEEEENAVDDIAEGEAEAEGADSSFTRKEDESAVVALLVEQPSEKSETGESTTTTSTTDESDTTTTPATTQEVDIVEGATNTTASMTADTTTDNDASPETKEDTGSAENHSKPEVVGEADVAVGSEGKEEDEAKAEAAEVTEKGGDAEEEGKDKET
ncbi:MOB kinase activator-like 4 [Leucoagaricus sp. SymC.cos]|nr:MOB kinase activator-like 4 [Leucoagaricus sp. SymC.cos]